MTLQPYQNQPFGVSIGYPAGWNVSENAGGAVVSFSPVDLTEATHISPCLNIVVQNLAAQPMALDEFTNISLYQMKQMLPDLKGIDVVDRLVAGISGKQVEYLTTLEGTELKFTQVFTLKDDTAYIITFSSPSSSHQNFRNTIEESLRSFKITEKKGVNSLCLSPYYNSTFSYFLRYPQNWTLVESQSKDVVQFTFNKDKGVAPTISFFVVVDKLTDKVDLNAYTKVLQANVKHAAASPNKLVVEGSQLGGFPAKKTAFYSSSLRVSGHYSQVWTVTNKHAGVLTFVHSVGQLDPDADVYVPIFRSIVDSFRFVASNEVVDQTLRYENISQKFGINYPKTYVPQEGFMGAAVSFAPHDSSPDKFQTNLNVVVQDMSSQPMTLSSFCDLLISQLEQTIQNCEIVGMEEVTMGGNPAREIKYAGIIEVFTVRFIQRVMVAGNRAVVVSFAAEKDKFEAEAAIMGKCLETFSFL
eukprot:TRINITY_DN1682_c0_g1_i1.p1 TRINITY_DN1682_c0_g1~~TRINITY_DN1682_c0_g1_i1.p1  ORF type:complete len:471 (-),score=119.20 TRINITY_DN1682_c0_g1_i1:20-1432(-)